MNSNIKKFIAPKAQILIVDDNIVTLNAEKELLELYQMNVSVVQSGHECLEIIKTQKFDIIFIDHIMPNMDGIDTAIAIRNLPNQYYKNLILIALTCNDSPHIFSTYIKNGFNDFLEKPLDLGLLNRVLRTYLSRNLIIEEPITSTSKKDYDNLNIPNVDVKKALLYCGNDINKYLSLLTVAYNDGKKKCLLIKEYAHNKDLNNYMIEVHSLKSVSSIIGNHNLSLLAKQHEEASLNGDLNFIEENFNNLILQYQLFLKNIEPFTINSRVPSRNKIKRFNKDKVIELIKSVANSIDDFDLDNSFKYLDELLHYNLGKDQIDILYKVKDYLNLFDYDSAYDLTAKLNEKITIL